MNISVVTAMTMTIAMTNGTSFIIRHFFSETDIRRAGASSSWPAACGKPARDGDDADHLHHEPRLIKELPAKTIAHIGPDQTYTEHPGQDHAGFMMIFISLVSIVVKIATTSGLSRFWM